MAYSILRRLNETPDAPLLQDEGRTLFASELRSWATAIAERILRHTSEPREKPIGILAPSSLEYAAALLGIWKAGAIAVPLQPAHPEAELAYIIEDTGLQEMWVHPSLENLAQRLQTTRPFEIRWIRESISDSPSQSETQSVSSAPQVSANAAKLALGTANNASDGALIIYTSGTTSRPKGVVSTYGSLDAQVQSLLQAWQWSSLDRTVNMLPLHHVHGVVNVLCCALAAGARCELFEKFDPATAWERIESGAINVFMAVPTIYTRLIQYWESQDTTTRERWSDAARKMRLMVSGSAALPAPVFERWREITGQTLLERYGMTEIGMALSNPYQGERRAGTVGFPLPGVEVRLAEENEIQIKGATVFREYWRKREATQQAFTSDGWFKTGDIAERDEDGYYRILGRSSQDIIKSGGYKISALEIESIVLENPSIAETAVIGVVDEIWGERVAAVCVRAANSSIEQDEVVSWLKTRLAHYKVPSLWLWVDALPRNAMGKVIKPQLRSLFSETSAAKP